jgi:hypothetical protein
MISLPSFYAGDKYIKNARESVPVASFRQILFNIAALEKMTLAIYNYIHNLKILVHLTLIVILKWGVANERYWQMCNV